MVSSDFVSEDAILCDFEMNVFDNVSLTPTASNRFSSPLDPAASVFTDRDSKIVARKGSSTWGNDSGPGA